MKNLKTALAVLLLSGLALPASGGFFGPAHKKCATGGARQGIAGGRDLGFGGFLLLLLVFVLVWVLVRESVLEQLVVILVERGLL